MDSMTITNAQYMNDREGNQEAIQATIDGESLYVPMDTGNRHYAEIMRQQSEGLLTIVDAD